MSARSYPARQARILKRISLALALSVLGLLGGGLPGLHAQSDDGVESIAADNGVSLLRQFQRDNPRAREHKMGLVSEAFSEDPSNPALRLDRVLVGSNGTLLEITGLPRAGRSDSAVIAYESLRLIDADKKEHPPLAFRGVAQLRAKRGGTALVVRPGDKLYLLMPAIDDFRPFALAYVGADLTLSRYFDEIDPRYRERYDRMAADALAPQATPEQMRDFLVEFGRDDPDRKAPQVFLALINRMRAQNTFEGFYNAYLLLQDPADAREAFRLSRGDAQRAQLENMAVSTLADKSRLLDLQFQIQPGSTRSGDGDCVMPCKLNFRASRTVSGTVSVRPRGGDSPIRLRYGTYKLTFEAELMLPRWFLRDVSQLGKADHRSDDVRKSVVTVTIGPPNYSANVSFQFDPIDLVFFERGSWGGYTAYWADGDARASIRLRGMELQQ